MRTHLLALLACLLAPACASEPENPLADLGVTEIYDRMGRRSIVKLRALEPEEEIEGVPVEAPLAGKGVGLGDGTWVLTAALLVEDDEVLRAIDAEGRTGTAHRIAVDEQRGLALLRLEGLRVEPARLAIEALPRSGEDLYLMVDDELSGFASLSGPLSGRRESPRGDLLRLWGRVKPEEVGGPVFATAGRVVGIVIPDELVDRNVRASYAQAVPELLEFLERTPGPKR